MSSGNIRERSLLIAGLLMALSWSTQASDCHSLDDLDWLMGHWEGNSEKNISTERWVRVSHDTVEITGRVFSLPHYGLGFREDIRLAAMGGEIFYIPKVAHNELPVAFRLTACQDGEAVFENPVHDSPNRIAYRLAEPGRVEISVSTNDGSGFSYSLQKKTPDRRIALTFDDAPRSDSAYLSGADRTRLLIDNLAAVDSPPVIFFSTARGIDGQGDARMRAYQEAGHYIGNHTYSHRRISSLGVEAYADDIRRAHDRLSQYDHFVPLFRFPFLDEGRDADTRDYLRKVLEELGYRNGYVTVDNYDFAMDALLQRAVKQGREINHYELGLAYVHSLMESVRFAESVASKVLDHVPAHSLLLHENDLAAMYIDDLVRALRAEGWTIIDAREAYEDPLGTMIPDTLFNNQGRVAAIARAKGVEARDLVHRAEDTVFLEQFFESYGAFGEPRPWMPGDSDLVFSSNRDGNSEIFLLPAGKEEWVNLTNHPASDNFPVWSPDGSRIAFQSRRNGKLDIFVMDADGGNLQQLTDHPEHDYLPSWTPDGKRITFASWRTEGDETPGSNHIYIMNADGSGQERLIGDSPGTSATVQWSPDAAQLVLTRKTGEFSSALYLADPKGNITKQLSNDERYNGTPVFSPGGQSIAFYSDDQEGSAIQVMSLDGSQRRTIVSYGQSYYPGWSPDGCWLVFTAAAVPGEGDDFEVRAIRADGYSDWTTLVTAPTRESEASWRPMTEKPKLACH